MNGKKELSQGKYDASSLIISALDREEGQFTADDVKNLAVKKGFSSRDVRKIMKGFKNLGSSSLKLDAAGKEFNVFSPTGEGAVRSSKFTGNKKGLDPGDIIGSGRNVNFYGGFAASLIKDFEDKKARPVKTQPSRVNDIPEGPSSTATTMTAENLMKPPVKKATFTPTGGGTGKKTTSSFTPKPTVKGGTWGGGQAGKAGATTTFEAPPQVELPTVAPEVASSMRKAVSERQAVRGQQESKQRQTEYSNFLKNRYSNVYRYLTDKTYKLNNLNKTLLSGDFEKILKTQPNLHKYIQKFHSDKLSAVEFRKGGKMGYQSGGKFPWTDDMMENPNLYEGVGGMNSTFTPSSLMNRRTIDRRGTGTPMFGDDFDLLDTAQGVAKYVIPFIGEGRARKELNKVSSVRYTPVELMKGVPRDMGRNYRPMYFRPEGRGSSLIETTASQKFGDAFNREQEFNWNLANEAQKNQARAQGIDATNRERMINTQGRLQTDMFNAQLKGAVQGIKYQSKLEPWVAAQQHLAKDTSERAYYQSVRDSNLAEMLIKNPEIFKEQLTPEQYNQLLVRLGFANNSLGNIQSRRRLFQ